MALVKCKECGKMISDEAGACPQCGCPVVIEKEEILPSPQPKKKSKKWIILLSGFVVLVGLGIYVYIAVVPSEERDKTGQLIRDKAGQIKDVLIAKKEPKIIYDGEVEIEEDKFHAISIIVEKASEITLEYSILSGPAIEVVSVNEENFQRWNEKKFDEIIPIAKLTSSGETSGTLVSELPMGTYYVIVENTEYGNVDSPFNLRTDVSLVQLKITVLEK